MRPQEWETPGRCGRTCGTGAVKGPGAAGFGGPMDLKTQVLERLNFASYYRQELPDLTNGQGGEAQALCPFHEDTVPSLSVNLKSGVFCCHGCKNKGDIFNFYQKIHGCDFKEALAGLARIAGVEKIPRPKPKQRSPGKIVATYDYHDSEGRLLFQVCRMQPKSFRQRRPDENGEWIWNINGVAPVPYHLPELMKAETVFISEGEKDCDNLIDRGLNATCNPMGAGKWRADYARYFKGKSVVVLPDNDPPGRSHALDVARSLHGVAGSVKVMELHGLPEKGDVSDWLAAGGTVEELLALAEAAPEFAPDTQKQDDSKVDTREEITRLIKGLMADSPIIDKLRGLAALAPVLAKMPYLEAAATMEELRERLKLRKEDLARLKADIKGARKAREKKGGAAMLAVDDLEENRKLHPAIDFLEEVMTIGFRVSLPDNETGLVLVSSDVKAMVNPEMLQVGQHSYQVPLKSCPPFVIDVWGLENLRTFLEQPTRPNNLYGDLVEAYKTFLDLPDSTYGLMAAWTVGTYYAHLFAAYPFLHFHGPKESGKSKSLEALRCVCFNAWKGRDITAAALGDTAEGQRGTLLLDQAERLNSDKESGNLLGLLADSYKKAGGQRRVVEVTKAGRSVLEFSTYGPKAFASTKDLDPDLADRCVKIPMTRTRRKLPDLEGWEPVWGELRDKVYRFTIMAFKEVRGHYEANPGNGTRIGELWRPLLAVLLTLGAEKEEIGAIRTLFMEAAEETRHELDPWESILFEVLKERAESEKGNFAMTAEEVLTAMDIEGDHKPGAKWVGNTLSRFSLFSERLPRKYTDDRKRKVQPYLFVSGNVLKMYEIYTRDTPQHEASQVSQVKIANDAGMFHGTKENPGTCPKASPNEEKEDLGLDGTCPEQAKRPIEATKIINDSDMGRMGRRKSRDVERKFSHFFDGGEVEL